jgi:hypothetical protein
MIWSKNNYGTKLRKPESNAFQIRSKLRNWNWISGYLGKKAILGVTQYDYFYPMIKV